MKLEKDEYFSDDCIIQDTLFLAIKDLLICPQCNNILKEPYMCDDCQNVYCKKCLEKYSNDLRICPNNRKVSQFSHCISKAELLSKIKYRCKNCKKEVIQSDIKSHLELNCKKTNIIERQKTLDEIIHSKKELIKLTKEEMKGKNIDSNLTGNNIFYNNFLF